MSSEHLYNLIKDEQILYAMANAEPEKVESLILNFYEHYHSKLKYFKVDHPEKYYDLIEAELYYYKQMVKEIKRGKLFKDFEGSKFEKKYKLNRPILLERVNILIQDLEDLNNYSSNIQLKSITKVDFATIVFIILIYHGFNPVSPTKGKRAKEEYSDFNWYADICIACLNHNGKKIAKLLSLKNIESKKIISELSKFLKVNNARIKNISKINKFADYIWKGFDLNLDTPEPRARKLKRLLSVTDINIENPVRFTLEFISNIK